MELFQLIFLIHPFVYLLVTVLSLIVLTSFLLAMKVFALQKQSRNDPLKYYEIHIFTLQGAFWLYLYVLV